MSTMELKSPVSKRNRNNIPKYPRLPIIPDDYSYSFMDETLKVTFSGYYNGNSVIVDDQEEIQALYNMGFFGKGSLSRSFPCFGKRKKGIPPVLKERQWKRRKEWVEKLGILLNKLPGGQVLGKADGQEKPIETSPDKNSKPESKKDDQNESPSKSSQMSESKSEEKPEVSTPMEISTNDSDEAKTSEQENKKSAEVSENKQEIEEKNQETEENGHGTKENENQKDAALEGNKEEIENEKQQKSEHKQGAEGNESEKVTDECENNKITEENPKGIGDTQRENDSKKSSNSSPEKDKSEKMDVDSTSNESLKDIVDISLSFTSDKQVGTEVKQEESEVLVIADYDMNEDVQLDNLNPHIENESLKFAVELLYLTLEEAFFLSYGLGCLNVADLTGQSLGIREMWHLFTKSQDDFIESYICYHYFRAKGCVVKSGLKFGGNYLLYKDGPPFYHASYVVIIENINKKTSNSNSTRSWEDMTAMYRMGETSKKEILVCQIQWPAEVEKLNCPTILKKFKVNEALLRRWLPCQEKEDE